MSERFEDGDESRVYRDPKSFVLWKGVLGYGVTMALLQALWIEHRSGTLGWHPIASGSFLLSFAVALPFHLLGGMFWGWVVWRFLVKPGRKL